MSTEEFITVGQIGRPRGLNGEIFVTPLTDFPERFENISEIFISEGGSWSKMKVVSSRFVSGRPVLLFENCNSPEDAARLTNKYLGVPKDQAMKLPQDSYYLFDLIGCEVLDEKNNKRIGLIIDVEEYPANDAYIIKQNDGKIASVAAVKSFIKKVDVKNKKVTIDVAGLIEE